MPLSGGRVYGEGWHGETFNVARESDPRGRTLESDLLSDSNDLDLPVKVYNFDQRQQKVVVTHRVPLRTVIDAVRRRGAGLVAKRIKHDDDPPRALAVFKQELKTYELVRAAYGRKTEEFTTLGALRLLLPSSREEAAAAGLAVHQRAPLLYLFSLRCQVPLDKHVFSDRDIPVFLDDMLTSFRILHSKNLFHCDVKLDNMILCSKSNSNKKKARRFKLIDWGAAVTLPALKRVYGRAWRSKNAISPVAWLAWGTASAWPAFFLSHAVVVQTQPAARCREFQQLLFDIVLSFNAFLDQNPALRALESRAQRVRLVTQFAPTFDLFNFGLVLARIACTESHLLSLKTRRTLMDLARRVTLYGHPGFTMDAAQLLLHPLLSP